MGEEMSIFYKLIFVAWVILLIAFIGLFIAFVNLHQSAHILVNECNKRGVLLEKYATECSRLNAQSNSFMDTLINYEEYRQDTVYCPFCIPISEELMKCVGKEWYVKIHGKWKWLSNKFLYKNNQLVFETLFKKQNELRGKK